MIWRKHFIVFKCEQKIVSVLVCFTSKSLFKRAVLIIAWCFAVLFSQYCVRWILAGMEWGFWQEWSGVSEGHVLLWCLYGIILGIFMIQKLFPCCFVVQSFIMLFVLIVFSEEHTDYAFLFVNGHRLQLFLAKKKDTTRWKKRFDL